MFSFDGTVAILILALILDRLIGDPPWLYRRLPHPVQLMGILIAALERWSFRRAATPGSLAVHGSLITLALIAISLIVGYVLQWLCLLLPFGWVLLAFLTSTLLAQASLAGHVHAVGEGLETGLAEGRAAVTHIVGRDPDQLDQHGVARSAIESLSENFSDGVVAPAFYAALFGLPGILVYKAINTADSMIGHRTERYLHFGRFAAKLDDVMNWLPARLSALLITVAARFMEETSSTNAWQSVGQDAHHHRSPNGGWPEAAMAGALNIRLSGPRSYDGKVTDEAWIGPGTPDVGTAEIDRALGLFWGSTNVLMAFLLLVIIGAALLVPSAPI